MAPRRVCNFFGSKAGCRNGSGCKFLHINSAAAQGSVGGGSTAGRSASASAGDTWSCFLCTFDNPAPFLRCGACNTQRDFVRPQEVLRDQFVNCPRESCSQYIQLVNPGSVERCHCPCGFVFCSQCLARFHGIPRPGASASSGAEANDDRLTCAGAAKITDAWLAWQAATEGVDVDDVVTPRSLAEKHHVDLSAFLDVDPELPQMLRADSSAYRLKCDICAQDVIGPRFSCIHCLPGFECCVGCSRDLAAQARHHDSATHVMQIYFHDEFPDQASRYFPQARCCVCFSDEKENMLHLESCRHSAHNDCLKGQLSARWPGKSISFNYLCCGECRVPLNHISLAEELVPHVAFKERVEEICLAQCREDDAIEDLEELWRADPAEARALCARTMTCLVCSSCNQPFCGGRVDCAEDASLDILAVRCPPCAFDLSQREAEAAASAAATATAGGGAGGAGGAGEWRGKCRKHGYKHAIYKCDSCCAVATFDCRSNHYCDRCHKIPTTQKNFPCPGAGTCPLGIAHPPNQPGVHGQVDKGFVVGCARCFTGSDELVLQSDGSAVGGVENWKERFDEG